MASRSSRKIVVGISGGVDSSVSLMLLKKAGWDPVGVSLKYPVWKDPSNGLRENVCCSAESFRIAKDICRKLDVPHHLCDVSREFKKEVIGYFLNGLRNARTPNPCVMCNRFLKFKKLFAWAGRRGIRHVATGHYARVRRDSRTGLCRLVTARDREKDQTYSLSFLSQAQLRNILLPLGDMTKREVYDTAVREGFEVFLKRKQSQDFCFVAGNSMGAFLAREVGVKEGEMRDDDDAVAGHHRGLHFYTIGQRKGLGLSGGPFFVKGFEPAKNVLRVTKDERALLQKEVRLGPCNFISGIPGRIIRVRAKIRYRQDAAPARLIVDAGKRATLVFDKPQRAVTPGQFAVFYQRDVCLGAGEIQG
ncbi:MAG TPA: tRNA 2-thiouridine(34) synthase MnmA [Candidatus Omnitrophota bacterium]|nr:tRNA 2-thiouridine(34) synthase MnmA [Candidatus Omnitrophota bacterium]